MKAGRTLAVLAAFLCAGCQYSPNMLDRAVAYNRVVADSTNQVLLLNIVRASQRLPTYYTRLEGDASSLGLTPNAGLTLPLVNPRSFETDINNGATGAVTSTGTKAIGSLAQFASSLGLSASESNLMTLQTLDDQKYQNGMMTPVPLKNIQAFQDEGYQRDLLFMMFLSSVQISGTLVDTIDAAVTARCGQARAGAGGDASFERQLCAYIDSAPYQSLFDPAKTHPAAYSFSLATCRSSGGAVSGDSASDMVRFNNDPAREGRRDAATDPHPEVCFQILLNDLLVLGLEVGSADDIPAGLVDVVPDSVAQDPKFRAQMIQQNFFFRETSTGNTAICKKKTAENGFTLAFTRSGARGVAEDPLSNLFGRLSAPPPKDSGTPPDRTAAPSGNPNAAYPADPVAACQLKYPGVPETPQQTALASTEDTPPKIQNLRPVKLSSDKIAFSTRSFEGMIYYLGEAVRYQDSADADPISFPRVLGRNPAVAGSGYFETLFYSTSRLPDDDAAFSVRDDSGTSFAVPKPCRASAERRIAAGIACSAEYPDNESLQVLNFVNQVWGLQKESVQGPSSPLVVVSPQ
jgi:hypothetical protein